MNSYSYVGVIFLKILYLIILALFYATFLAKAFLLKRKGVRVNIMFKSKFKEKSQLATLITGVLSVVAGFVSIVFELGIHDVFWLKVAGAIVSAVGTLIFVKAVCDMKSSWRVGVSPDEETKLVTNGIYSVSRNPAYLGFGLMYIGIMIGYFNPLISVVFISNFVTLDTQAKIEEKFLEKSFGEEYIAYKNKVGRYI